MEGVDVIEMDMEMEDNISHDVLREYFCKEFIFYNH